MKATRSLRIWILTIVAALLIGSAYTLPNDKYFEIAKNLEIFTSVYKELHVHYVDDLDPNTIMRTGIDAIMDKLDPYTVYYSESQVESYRLAAEGKYHGLGAASDDIDGKFTITEIYKDGPAYTAGLQVGDQITHINGRSAADRSYQDMIQFMRGAPGTSIDLSVYRPATGEDKTHRLTRSEVEIPNVPYAGMLRDGVGYIALTTFTRDAGKNIARELRKMKDEQGDNLQGVILDLRGNGGGLLAEAIDIVGIFLPKGSPAVSTKGKVRDRDVSYDTRRSPVDTELPMVVMTNGSSASASEIVSGTIQDYDRGVVMGQRTFGKGLVQNTKEVGYNSRIKLTTSKYYIPSGRCIQAVEYADGLPVDIPDDRRETFFTAGGRPVLDGGGVTPDVKLDIREKPEILVSLEKDHWIFKYVNEKFEDTDVEDVRAFSFEGYDDFKSWLRENNFSWTSKAEKKASELQDVAGDTHKSEVDALLSSVLEEKEDDLDQHMSWITAAIELEIVKRYHYQEGKTIQKLKRDAEIEEAINLLNNPAEYRRILSK
ncbi:MAG: S41 family peptidase [Bacteroidota bacterium]